MMLQNEKIEKYRIIDLQEKNSFEVPYLGNNKSIKVIYREHIEGEFVYQYLIVYVMKAIHFPTDKEIDFIRKKFFGKKTEIIVSYPNIKTDPPSVELWKKYYADFDKMFLNILLKR